MLFRRRCFDLVCLKPGAQGASVSIWQLIGVLASWLRKGHSGFGRHLIGERLNPTRSSLRCAPAVDSPVVLRVFEVFLVSYQMLVLANKIWRESTLVIEPIIILELFLDVIVIC